jgi:hypothetical protein
MAAAPVQLSQSAISRPSNDPSSVQELPATSSHSSDSSAMAITDASTSLPEAADASDSDASLQKRWTKSMQTLTSDACAAFGAAGEDPTFAHEDEFFLQSPESKQNQARPDVMTFSSLKTNRSDFGVSATPGDAPAPGDLSGETPPSVSSSPAHHLPALASFFIR